MSPGSARARPSATMVKILEYIYVTSHPTAPPQVLHGYAGDSSDSNIVSESKLNAFYVLSMFLDAHISQN